MIKCVNKLIIESIFKVESQSGVKYKMCLVFGELKAKNVSSKKGDFWD